MKFWTLFSLFLVPLTFYTQVEKNSLLWEITNPKSDQKSYLFGTMHIMDQASFFLPKKIESLLGKSAALCMEINSLSSEDFLPNQLLLENGSFNNFFSKEECDSIYLWANEKLLMTAKQFDENFEKAKPFLVLQFILQNSLPENPKAQEVEIETYAKKKDLIILGFETIDEQLKLFDNLSSFEQKTMIMQALRNQEKAKQEFKELQSLYLSQNLDSLYSYIRKDSSLPNSRVFLEDRNLRWIPLIKEMIENQKVFIAVGAAHLPGKEGLIELLIKEGYELKAVKL
jgi:uncharacterized protein